MHEGPPEHPHPPAILLAPALLSLLFLGCEPGKADQDSGGPLDTEVTGDPHDSQDSADTSDSEPDTSDSDDTEHSADTDSPFEDPWKDLLAQRDGWLLELSVPILACVENHDTSHPVFHGCIDWHSNVHATWSLLALGRLTGDPLYTNAADAVLDPEGLEEELLNVESGYLAAMELPYGFSWFLVLARERERGGDTDLIPLRDAITEQLIAHVFSLTDSQIRNRMLSANYQNLSWELLNLYEQALHMGDKELQAQLQAFVREEILPISDDCPLEDETYTSNFFPPCLQLARLVTRVLPEKEAASWLEGRVPDAWDLEPETRITAASPHLAGLNFSRAWGLYALWHATSDEHLLQMYYDHVSTQIDMPEAWAKDYYAFSHWVAQFGVYALALSWEDPPRL